MKNPKILPPTLRDRKRYLAYQVVSDKKLEFSEINNVIWYSVMNFMGERGAAEADVWVIRNTYEDERKIGLIKCSHTSVEDVRTALALVQKMGENRLIIRVLGISGTMKAAKKKFFGEKDLTDYV
ncbi:MAG: ribonuclease P protein component 2 [Candidatus Aenigmarchaeota archaeon]|nr:ribonuclease P protein component 2 [Candidatus Aenigmarchaeota archaeon]